MSPEHREGQPQQEITLLKPPPEIYLLAHTHELETSLQKKVGKVIFQNNDLIATQKEYRKQSSTEYIGHVYVHNKTNGLPNYAMKYKRIGEQIFMQSAHLWDYQVIDDPEPSLSPMLVANEIIAEKLGRVNTSFLKAIKTIIDVENKEELLWGEGKKPVRKADVFYDSRSNKLINSVQSQIDKLPGFRRFQY